MSATTTDVIDSERAERLARLRERRGAEDRRPAATDATSSGILPSPTRSSPRGPGRHEPATDRAAARRSPAATARIVTVGASTTAVLGMIAGYGIADRAAATPPEPTLVPAADQATATGGTTVPPASPVNNPPPPQVIVVMVDAATGRPVAADAAVPEQPSAPGPGTDAPAAGSTIDGADGTVAASPAPVAAPTAIDLAVPAPPPPPAPSAAPRPVPQASSGGS